MEQVCDTTKVRGGVVCACGPRCGLMVDVCGSRVRSHGHCLWALQALIEGGGEEVVNSFGNDRNLMLFLNKMWGMHILDATTWSNIHRSYPLAPSPTHAMESESRLCAVYVCVDDHPATRVLKSVVV